MTGFGIKIQFVDSFQVGYALPRVGAERMLAIERVQHDPFQQIAERHVVIFSQAFQDLEQAFLKANPGLNSLNQYSFTLRFRCLAYLRQAVSSCCLWYYSTMVLMYRDAVNSRCSKLTIFEPRHGIHLGVGLKLSLRYSLRDD